MRHSVTSLLSSAQLSLYGSTALTLSIQGGSERGDLKWPVQRVFVLSSRDGKPGFNGQQVSDMGVRAWPA